MIHRLRQRQLWCAALFGLLGTAASSAQAATPRIVELSGGAEMVYQPVAAAGHLYTPVILLPYTGGTAQDLYNWKYRSYFNNHPKSDVVLILPPEEGDDDDYETGEDWAETVREWEEDLAQILDEANAQLPLDRDKVVLAGHSMGGDMAWALMQRKPDRYTGAVIMGSRCNWREQGSPKKLAERAVRVVFSIGDKELKVRRQGAEMARGLLEKFGVNVRWDEPSGGHVPAPGKLFFDQIDYVLNPATSEPKLIKTANAP